MAQQKWMNLKTPTIEQMKLIMLDIVANTINLDFD